MLLPALLSGRTFTHRLSDAEVEHGYLTISPDLEAVSILTDDPGYRRLVDGSSLIEALPSLDAELFSERGIPLDAVGEAAWILDPDALTRVGAGAGDLVGVTVRRAGFELAPVFETVAPESLDERLVEALRRLGKGDPEQIDSVVWLVCAHDPDLFTVPLPPLSELAADAGLLIHGEHLAPPGSTSTAGRCASGSSTPPRCIALIRMPRSPYWRSRACMNRSPTPTTCSTPVNR